MMQQNPKTAIMKARKHLIIGFIAATLLVNSIILLAGDAEARTYFGNVLASVTAAIATGLSIMVVYRQKLSGIFGRAYAGLAAGLGLFLVAEILRMYYSIGLGIEAPFPSVADAFWLAAYAPFGYGLFKLSSLYSKRGESSKKTLVIMGILVAAFSSHYITQLIAVSDLTAPDAGIVLTISIAYPILDAILIIPALLAIMSGAGRGYLTSVPWIFVAWVLFAIADSIFGFSSVVSIGDDSSATNMVLYTNLYYNAAFLSMAAGMYWHNKYMIFNDKNETSRLIHLTKKVLALMVTLISWPVRNRKDLFSNKQDNAIEHIIKTKEDEANVLDQTIKINEHQANILKRLEDSNKRYDRMFDSISDLNKRLDLVIEGQTKLIESLKAKSQTD